jgi:RNA polymerase sigma-70 factor, ECF subfamily
MMGRLRRAIEFDALIRDNEDDLWRYFQRRISNPADAAEAFGELLLTAWRRRRRIPADSIQARMWLFTAARNVTLNARRTLARHSAAVQRLIEEASLDAAAPEDPLVDELKEALNSLAEEDAELIASSTGKVSPPTRRRQYSASIRLQHALD